MPFLNVQQVLRSMRVYSIEPAKLREMQDPDVGSTLRSDGSNAASVLAELARDSPEDVRRICEILASIVPGTKRVRTVKYGKQLSLRFTQEWGEQKRLPFEAFSMSDGTLRALGLLLAVYQRPTPSLIVIEEPEATIHPGALGAILDVLRVASRKMQVIVTTHSPDVLDAKWIEAKNLRVVNWDKGSTQVAGISEMSKKALQDHLMGAGELLRSNALIAPELFEDIQQLSLFEDVPG
jgi:predicted ATPase